MQTKAVACVQLREAGATMATMHQVLLALPPGLYAGFHVGHPLQVAMRRRRDRFAGRIGEPAQRAQMGEPRGKSRQGETGRAAGAVKNGPWPPCCRMRRAFSTPQCGLSTLACMVKSSGPGEQAAAAMRT